MQDFSLHMHTIEFDAKNSIEEMALKAKKLGLTTIGISNHFRVHPIYSAPEYLLKTNKNMYFVSFEEATEVFRSLFLKIENVSKKLGIKILKGMEVDAFSYSGWNEGFRKAKEILKPDYTIGSVHFVEKNNKSYSMQSISEMSPQEQDDMIRRYWEKVCKIAESGMFTWLGHIDYIKKAGLGGDMKWTEYEEAAIKALKKSGTGLEINTASYALGLQEPYPSARILKIAAAYEVPVLLSDDAHQVESIMHFFKEAESFAKRCGIKHFFSLQEILSK